MLLRLLRQFGGKHRWCLQTGVPGHESVRVRYSRVGKRLGNLRNVFQANCCETIAVAAAKAEGIQNNRQQTHTHWFLAVWKEALFPSQVLKKRSNGMRLWCWRRGFEYSRSAIWAFWEFGEREICHQTRGFNSSSKPPVVDMLVSKVQLSLAPWAPAMPVGALDTSSRK